MGVPFHLNDLAVNGTLNTNKQNKVMFNLLSPFAPITLPPARPPIKWLSGPSLPRILPAMPVTAPNVAPRATTDIKDDFEFMDPVSLIKWLDLSPSKII